MSGGLQSVDLVDWVAGAILALAALRGLYLGLIREVASVASLLAACFVVRRFTPDVAAWMLRSADGGIDPALAPWLAGAALAFGTIAAGALIGRVLRRGAELAWLGLPDRIGGALLGVAEGALVCAILLVGLTSVVGRDHALLAGSRSVAALERLEEMAGAGPRGIDVAAPPPPR
ncbi:MAG TPA: CvpA family protein, partial [Myxococcota bacterium]|nr:CvpA family protein [Myxococcota bacterium]